MGPDTDERPNSTSLSSGAYFFTAIVARDAGGEGVIKSMHTQAGKSRALSNAGRIQ